MAPDSNHVDVTRRFATRTPYYIRFRPTYPAEMLDFLEDAAGLKPGRTVADIGAGTGLLARRFLEYGCRVYGIEPNKEMREAGEVELADYPHYTSVDGRAEATGLADTSVDLVIAGQAFHWFEPRAARRELARILRKPRFAAMIWNMQDKRSPLVQEYQDALYRYGEAYSEVEHTRPATEQALAEFYGSQGFTLREFPNEQHLDLEGFLGRFLSTSTAPLPGHPEHEPAVRQLTRAFEIYARDGTVRFPYRTRVCLGTLE